MGLLFLATQLSLVEGLSVLPHEQVAVVAGGGPALTDALALGRGGREGGVVLWETEVKVKVKVRCGAGWEGR